MNFKELCTKYLGEEGFLIICQSFRAAAVLLRWSQKNVAKYSMTVVWEKAFSSMSKELGFKKFFSKVFFLLSKIVLSNISLSYRSHIHIIKLFYFIFLIK